MPDSSESFNGLTLYQVLGVGPTADIQTIKDQYHKLAKLHHPDAGGNEGTFIEIRDAAKVLLDSKARVAYDERLRFTMEKCQRCNGTGLASTQRKLLHAACPSCGGAGFNAKKKG